VSETKWINPHQPQTLYIATLLCYLDAVFGLLFFPGSVLSRSPILGVLIIAALGVGGYGVANEKKWGYTVAVVGAVGQLLALLAVFGASTFTSLGPLISFFFDAALVGLLLHPMSRDYQRIWFR
jgi:hypothetical protein